MKPQRIIIWSIGLSIVFCLPSFGQGTINFTNFAPPAVDAIVTSSDGRLVEGDNFKAELFVGDSPASLVSIPGGTSGFLTGDGAGYFVGGTVTIVGLEAGSRAFAAVAYSGERFVAYSDVISLTLGGSGNPPAPPANLGGLRPAMIFVPEPGSIALILVGLSMFGGVKLFRRK